MYIKSKISIYAIMLIGVCVMFTIGCGDKEKLTKTVVQNADTSLFTDAVNNQTYKIVKIGGQWWMAENLKSTKYRDGSAINNVTSDTAWNNNTTGAYCSYDLTINVTGFLYNWYAVTNTHNLAPAGWHLPSDEEWKALEIEVGMSSADANKINWRGTDEACKLKKEAKLGWQTYTDETWPNNESGFSALGGSCRLFNGKRGEPGLQYTGYWWTATTAETNDKAYYRYMDYKTAKVFRNSVSKAYGFNVRCVKD